MGKPGTHVICSTGRFWSSHLLADPAMRATAKAMIVPVGVELTARRLVDMERAADFPVVSNLWGGEYYGAVHHHSSGGCRLSRCRLNWVSWKQIVASVGF